MSTPKISFRVPTPGAGEPEATGDVVTQDLSSAPGKEREREPLYGGEIGNLSEGMAIDVPAAGECSPSILSNFKKQRSCSFLWNVTDVSVGPAVLTSLRRKLKSSLTFHSLTRTCRCSYARRRHSCPGSRTTIRC